MNHCYRYPAIPSERCHLCSAIVNVLRVKRSPSLRLILRMDDGDDILALLDQNNSDNDEPDFPLPSERKQSTGNQRGKRRRPPARKPMISLDHLLDSNSGAGDNSSEPNSSASDMEDISEKTTNQKGKKTIDKLERSLTDYISHTIDKVRREFVSELSRMLDNSQEEESIINTFILGLPAEMEQVVVAEIALGRAQDGRRDADQLQLDVESQIDSLWKVIPKCPTRNGERITVRSLANKIVTSKTEMATSNDEILNDLQSERASLVAAREQLITASENSNSLSTMRSLRMEIEANAKRLDVEEQYNKTKIKRLEDMQREWREMQTSGPDDDNAPDHVILRKLESMANMAPRSKLRNTVGVLGSLLETAKRNYEDMRNQRVQLELELESLSYAMRPIEEPLDVPKETRKMRARRYKPRENVLDEAKEKLSEIRKTRHRK